jgi:carboxymethylenebutenolidase
MGAVARRHEIWSGSGWVQGRRDRVIASMAPSSGLALPYFLSRPATGAATSGVVVIHEANGITAQVLRFCQRVADHGYMVVAPDLYFRAGGTESAPYSDLVATLVDANVSADLIDAADILRAQGATKVGTIGFCMGGRLAYRMAVTSTDFDAAAIFYGTGIPSEFGEPRRPIQLFFGSEDRSVGEDELQQVASRHPRETHIYAGARHGFMRDGSDFYDPDSAQDAWQRLLTFLDRHLR